MRKVETRFANTPFASNAFDSAFQDFDRFFGGQNILGLVAPVVQKAATISLPYELTEDDKSYLLSFDVPGVSKDDIQIEVKDQQLRLSGERKRTEQKNGESARTFTERRYGRFERVFTLPADVDADKIQAHNEDGVLHLMLPKAEKVQAKSIKIESGPTGFFSRLVGEKKDDKLQ